MRRPSHIEPMLWWWRKALAGEQPQVTAEPQCGYFKRKLAKGAAWMPVRIYLHQALDESGELTEPEEIRCEVAGKVRDPVDQWTWVCAEPITKQQYDYMMAVKAWAEQHASDQPEANPYEKIDHNKLAIPF